MTISSFLPGRKSVCGLADTSSFTSTPGGKVGHISRTVGNVPNVQLIIKLKPRAGAVYAGKPCAV